jgi:phage terminase small subunit
MAAGSTKPRAGTAERRQAFVRAYIANGHNATQAAIEAGYSPKTARSQGQRLLTNVDISRDLAVVARDLAATTGLETKRTVQEVARICYFDPLGLLDPDGKFLPLAKMAPEVRACISSMDFDKNTGRVTHVRFYDKNAALEKAMKHHGLYDKDNGQKGENIKINS